MPCSQMKRRQPFAFALALVLAAAMLRAADEPGNAPLFRVEDYPRVEGSTSAQPLVALAACRLTRTAFEWRHDPLRGTRLLYPRTTPFDPDKRLSLAFAARPRGATFPLRRDQEAVHAALLERIKHSGTHQALVAVIEGEADVAVAARGLSPDEQALAREKGVEIRTVPVALDAFVFLVNKENPLKDMTVEQIRGIYTGKIAEWKEIGGPEGAINPYQRERNSGSQDTMEKLVMEGREMVEHRPSEMALSMVGPFNAIRHDRRGLGYTFRYYDTYMTHMPEVEMVAVNGVAPAPENIANRTYPFVTDVVLAWRADMPEDAPGAKLREWFLSEEGQAVVAESGYVPVGLHMVSREDAIEIARESIEGHFKYDETREIQAELKDGQYIVTFPFRELGPTERGPDYAAQVWVDAWTGDILKLLAGS